MVSQYIRADFNEDFYVYTKSLDQLLDKKDEIMFKNKNDNKIINFYRFREMVLLKQNVTYDNDFEPLTPEHYSEPELIKLISDSFSKDYIDGVIDIRLDSTMMTPRASQRKREEFPFGCYLPRYNELVKNNY